MNESQKERAKICIIGLGYIGLPLSVFLAENGYLVLGVDINKDRISRLKEGKPLIGEQGFLKHFKTAINSKRLSFQTKPEPSDIFFIAVQTPFNSKLRKADLSFIKNALNSILPHLSASNIIILESTVPPFTCRKIIKTIVEKQTQFKVPEDILVAYCPERAYPGNLVHEFLNNDRIIGGMSSFSTEKAYNIYSSFVKGQIFLTDDITAEIVKLAENAFRDINIAFANELRFICDSVGVDHKKVVNLANYHPRVQIHQSGIGVGGHCIPIDPWFLWEINPSISRLIPLARGINDSMPEYITEKIIHLIPSNIADPKVVIIGKTYKPNVGDTRESPALKIIKLVTEMRNDAEIIAVDPYVDELSVPQIDHLVESSDLLVVLVPHQEVIQYIKKNEKKLKRKMRTPNFIIANEL